MKKFLLTALLTTLVTPAFADSDTLNLFPKGREDHQAAMDSSREQMDAQAQAYLDNLYEYQGEGGVSHMSLNAVTEAKPRESEAALDAYINGTASLNDDVKSTTAPTEAPPLPTAAAQ